MDNKKEDPDMMNNLASRPEYQNILNKLRQDLEIYLKATKDPRIQGLSPWDKYNLDEPAGQLIRK